MNSFLGIHSNILEDGMLFNPCVYVLLLRNHGPEPSKVKDAGEEAKTISNSTGEQYCFVSDATTTSALGLGHASTIQKDHEVFFPTDPDLSQNST